MSYVRKGLRAVTQLTAHLFSNAEEMYLHRIIELLSLERTFKIIKPNHSQTILPLRSCTAARPHLSLLELSTDRDVCEDPPLPC